MGYNKYLIEDDKPVLGYTFQEMTEFLTAMFRLMRFDDRWTINGFSLTASTFDDCSFASATLSRGIRCYEQLPTEKTRWNRSGIRFEDRWGLELWYEQATGDQFDLEHEFRLTDRHDKFISNELRKLSLRSIIFRHRREDGDQVVEEPVAKDVRALFDRLADVQRSTSNLTEWGASPYGMVIRCTQCRHRKTIDSTKIASVFTGFVSVQEVSEKLLCSKCRQKGQVEIGPVVGPVA